MHYGRIFIQATFTVRSKGLIETEDATIRLLRYYYINAMKKKVL